MKTLAEAFADGTLRSYCVYPHCSKIAGKAGRGEPQYCIMHRVERGETVICPNCRQSFVSTKWFPCIACGCEQAEKKGE